MLYEQGNYQGCVVDQGFGESKEKKTPYFFLELEVSDLRDKFTGEWKPVERSRRTVWMYLTEKTMQNVVAKLELLGYSGATLSDLNPENEDHHSFLDSVIKVYCKHEEYNGDLKEKWEISTGGGGLQHTPIQKSAKSKLDAMFGKFAKKPAKQALKTRTAASKPTNQKETFTELSEADHRMMEDGRDDAPY